MTVKATEAAIRKLSKMAVYIGIPKENNPRQGSPLGNAAIGYIHEFGSPARNIPARPFLNPGIKKVMPEIQKHLRKAAEAALAGDEAGVKLHLGRAGAVGARSAQATIQAGIPPPLKQSTVDKRRDRGTGSTYRRLGKTPADVTPLFDTGALLGSITYRVRNK